MRPIVTPEQMRALDSRTIDELGLPGIVLMELAARGVMTEIENLYRGDLEGLHALVFCGGGNNGGDGFAVARRLLNARAIPRVYLLADRERVDGDARANLEIYERLGGEVVVVEDPATMMPLPETDLIVDALLGTGLEGAARGRIGEAIKLINSHGAPVISVDIPSGVNGATGAVEGPAVRAHTTVTFGEIKVGHLITPGLNHAGRIARVDIQIPPEYVDEIQPALLYVDAPDVAAMLPDRPIDAHKGTSGKVLLVAGSVGMTGAAQLAGRATLRTGAGLVKVATANNALSALAGGSAEIMTIPLPDTENGTIAKEAETTVDEARTWADVEVIGPGLSLNEETTAWFAEHAADLPLPTVIDADGLNALAKNSDLLKQLPPHVVLTPHIGELARLTGLTTDEIAEDRVEVVRRYAREWGLILLLKGVPTLVGNPKGEVFAMLTGNPGMASAGMGDVLTGVIAGLLAQGLDPEEAAIAATMLHGLAGNLAAQQVGGTGFVAGDVIERLPQARDMLTGRGQPQGGGCCGGGGCGGHDHGCGDGCDCDGDCDCGGEGGCGCH